jgi:hypothetical protein
MKRMRFTMRQMIVVLALVALGIYAVLASSVMNRRKPAALRERPHLSDKELELIEQVKAASSPEERSRLISQLEQLPVKIHPFYSRWCAINDVDPFHCWTEDGYDPSLSDCPRDIQLLAATDYGKSDIDNGGFHQFFSNGTGVFAPEMIEWFERAGLAESASVMKEATAVFGQRFPRSQAVRREFLASFKGDKRADWDPFYRMDDRFYASLPYDKKVFDAAADRWLREVCGMKSLHDTLAGRTRR